MKNIIYRIGVHKFCIMVCLQCMVYATQAQSVKDKMPDTTIFRLTPVRKPVVVNGMAFGVSAYPFPPWDDSIAVKVNGFNLELGPTGIIGGIWGTMFGLVGVKDDAGNRQSFFARQGGPAIPMDEPRRRSWINGLSVSLGGISDTYHRGISLNGLSSNTYRLDGVQVTGIYNSTRTLNGLSIALLANVSQTANGLQIALINNCQTGNVVQIGLFNRIGRRILPFMNLRFGKTKV